MNKPSKRQAPSPAVRAKGAAALAEFRAAKAKAKAEGRLEEWEAEQKIKSAQKRISPQQAIKNFCNGCVGGVQTDITNCTAKQCPLYIYRPYQKGSE